MGCVFMEFKVVYSTKCVYDMECVVVALIVCSCNKMCVFMAGNVS